MKKIITFSLAAILALSAVVFANGTNEYDTMLISETEETVVMEDSKVSYNGTVTEVTEEYIVIGEGEFQFNLDENTYVCDYDLNPVEEIKKDDMITVIASSMTTRSLPPQAYAYYVIVNTEGSAFAPIYAVVDTNENGEILSKDGNNRIVYSDETAVIAHRIRIALKASDITPGSEILAFATTVGLSLPAHVPAEKIAVLSLAEQVENENEFVIDGHTFEYADEALFEEGSQRRLPLRHVLETLGYTVNWNDADWSIDIAGKTRNIVRIKIGEAMFEGQSEENFPVLVDSKTYVTAEIFDLLTTGAE